MSKQCYIVEYTYGPDSTMNHVCDDAFMDAGIVKQFMLSEAEDTLDNYDDVGEEEYIMSVSWQEDKLDTNHRVKIIRNGVELDCWTIKQCHLNTQTC